MYKFPDGLYTDVRIEDVATTTIQFTKENLDDSKERNYKAAFIRVFDGKKWLYASTSEIENVQNEINNLAQMAEKNENINEHPIVKKFQVNKGKFMKFENEDVSKIKLDEKIDLLKGYFPVVQNKEYVKMWNAFYVDQKKIKSFYSSLGAELEFDTQLCGFAIYYQMADGDKRFSEGFPCAANTFDGLRDKTKELTEFYEKSEDFLLNSTPVEPGEYTVILSPMAAGVFAHESFGHKSEADFMLGDETMKKEWAIGKKIGSDILSILDDGNEAGSGYVPFDDEGTRAEKTYLIKEGVLSDRLHSTKTAAALEENVTGNARSMNFEYEPIVRMTTTYIDKGDKTKEELFSEVKNGFYVETIKHGSGMSTFTIAPSLAYRIKDGKIAEPVRISVVTGNVFSTLGEIDGLSDTVEILSFVGGGCGKMEQYPLPVGFGGPYVRVKKLNVQ